jgi:hypothetical protein
LLVKTKSKEQSDNPDSQAEIRDPKLFAASFAPDYVQQVMKKYRMDKIGLKGQATSTGMAAACACISMQYRVVMLVSPVWLFEIHAIGRIF